MHLLHLLNWQADSLPPWHLGSQLLRVPRMNFKLFITDYMKSLSFFSPTTASNLSNHFLPSSLSSVGSVQSLSRVWLFEKPWTACSTPGSPVHHQHTELTQIHVHQVRDAIQPSHPLLSPSLPAFNLSQHQGLFKWVNSLNQVAKVLGFQLQHQSFQWIFRTDFLQDWLVGSLCSSRDCQEFSPTPQFKSINSLVLSFHYGPNLTSIHDYWKHRSFD